MGKKLLQYYLNLPIRYKIMLWFIPLFIVTITATGIMSYRIAADEIIKKMNAVQKGTAHLVVDHLDYIAQDAIDISNYIFLTPEIQHLLSADQESGPYIVQEVIDSINRLMVTRPYFQFLTLYSSHFTPIQFNNKGLSAAIPFEEYRQRFHYDELLLNRNIETWSIEVPGVTDRVFSGDKMNKLLLTKVLKNNSKYSPEGVLILGIDEKDIRNSYALMTGDAAIVVMNTDGTILSDNTGNWLGQPFSNMSYYNPQAPNQAAPFSTIDNSKWMFTHLESPLTGWKVLVIQPRKELLQQLNRIQWITAIIIGFTILLSLLFAWAISGLITKQLLTILKSMKKFQKGNFSQKVQITGMDEIGQLGSGYNIMVQRVKELIDDLYSVELKQKEAELKALQSQINPHFLYNTLNTIAWSAQKNKDEQVAEMIYALSNIFKISLNEGNEFFTLEQEFTLVNNYLFLQKMRFPNKLTYELEMDQELKNISLPKLLIQPLVENAVVHGIQPLDDDVGFIHIKAYKEFDHIILEIMDDGVGIPMDKLGQLNLLLAQESSASKSVNFALSNVADRIRMVYGEQSVMDIQSTVGSGTRVLLILPMKR